MLGSPHEIEMAKNRVPLSSCLATDRPSVTLPGNVVKAMQIPFEIEVTALLWSVRLEPGELSPEGTIFGDREQRFEDGASTVTPLVLSSQELQGFLVVHTLRSVYVVCDWSRSSANRVSETQH